MKKIVVRICLTLIVLYLGSGYVKTCIHFIYFKYPKFCYKSISMDDLGIPVFMFHTVTSDALEKELKYLHDNNYLTVSTDEFYHFIQTGEKPANKCVLLTVDDGRKSLYQVIYPLLEKYKMKATAFILPYHHDHPNELAEYIPVDRKSDEEIFECSFDGQMFCSWNEIIEMHQSGYVEMQSHTFNQYRVPISDEIVDFYHPDYHSGFALDRLPVFTANEFTYQHALDYGRPIYKNASRVGGFKAYYEDMMLYSHCCQYVDKNGGIEFFNNNDWQKVLFDVVLQYKKLYAIHDFYESDDKYCEVVQNIIFHSKAKLENKIKGYQVRFIATPWGETSHFTAESAKSADYSGLFITDGIGMRTCQYGENPYLLPRIDHKNKMMLSLPGKGRMSFLKRYLDKWMYYLLHPVKM